ncbi:MAG: sulfite exporter TauE/SafE family protein, partial [Planctomycetota bacterium]
MPCSSRRSTLFAMTLELAAILAVCGCAVGFINTLAGGGSALAFSALDLAGLPLDVVNGTYRIAAVLQSVVSTGTFHRQDRLDVKTALLLGIPASVGAALGALIAVDIDETLFRRIVAFVLIAFLAALIVRPDRWAPDRKEDVAAGLGAVDMVVFFGVGIYGGFIHIGVGYLMLMAVLFTTG